MTVPARMYCGRQLWIAFVVSAALMGQSQPAFGSESGIAHHRLGFLVGALAVGSGHNAFKQEDFDVPLAGSPGGQVTYSYRIAKRVSVGVSLERWMILRAHGKESGGFWERYAVNGDFSWFKSEKWELAGRLGLGCSLWWLSESQKGQGSLRFHAVGPGASAHLVATRDLGAVGLLAALGAGTDWMQGERREWRDVDGNALVSALWLTVGLEIGLDGGGK